MNSTFISLFWTDCRAEMPGMPGMPGAGAAPAPRYKSAAQMIFRCFVWFYVSRKNLFLTGFEKSKAQLSQPV